MQTAARDHYERYYSEKLWAMVPDIYRDNDGEANPPGVLRAFVETLATNAAVVRRSNDKLWDDQFIEICSEWAVPYIGQLVATRMVSALNRRGRRIDVAKTIYYRRRKGTPRILEELIADIAGWEGKLVEEFRALGRFRHNFDPQPGPLAGRFTQTPPGGWADLRNTRGAELAGTPFDEFHYTPDVRQTAGRLGLYGIAKLGFHLYRLVSNYLEGVAPLAGPKPGSFTFDPSGRNLRLFIRAQRTDDRKEAYDWESWQSPQEWDLPGPIGCRTLNHAEFTISAQALATITPLLTNAGLSAADVAATTAALEQFEGVRYRTEAELSLVTGILAPVQAAALTNPAVWAAFLETTMVSDCARFVLLPPGAPNAVTNNVSLQVVAAGVIAPRESIVAGNLSDWTIAVANKQWVIDPVLGRLFWVGAGAAPTPTVTYCYGFSASIGAGAYDRSDSILTAATNSLKNGGAIAAVAAANGVTEIGDSLSYTPVGDCAGLTIYEFRAANFQRPYLALATDWTLDTGANTDSALTLEGLWIGAQGAPRTIILKGDYATVTLSHVTLDPGGVNAQGAAIPPVTLRILGDVGTLVIDHSITGPLVLDPAGTVLQVQITDSIIDGQNAPAAAPAIAISSGHVSMERVTVFGEVDLEWLYASETLIAGFADVVDNQAGCFRFSAVLQSKNPLDPTSPPSRVPRMFESYLLTGTAGFFTSTVFGEPGYAQLSAVAPDTLQRGAENGSEIGAFSGVINPIKFDGLRAKIDEFAPFGVIPFYIFET